MVIIVGDLHLGSGQRNGKPGIGATINSRIDDQFNLLDWILDKAINELISSIIITGDIFDDPKPQPSLITLFVSWLKKCQAHNIAVYMITGNHDILRNGNIISSPLDIINEMELDNIFVFKQIKTVMIGSMAFTFVPFCDRKSYRCNSNLLALEALKSNLIYELAGIPITYKKVLIGHLAIEGSIPVSNELDDITNELFCPIDLFNDYDFVWMGHIHKPQVLNTDPFVAHIGSMDISNFGEIDQKKNIVILDDNGNFINEYLPIRPFKKISIVIPKNIKETTNYVLDEIKNIDFNKSIVKIDVSLSSPEMTSINKLAIEQFLNSNGAFNIVNISESKKTILIKKDNNLNTKMDISSAIKIYSQNYISEEKRSDFIDLAMEIYSSEKNM
jgi:exonuclease SbcD